MQHLTDDCVSNNVVYMNNSTLQVKSWMAQRLDTAIKQSGMRIDAICKKSGMPYSTLNAKRTGYSSLTFEDVALLAPILGFPGSYFVPPQFTDKSENQRLAA